MPQEEVRLAPMVNHWWQVPLYVSARGLTTSPIPVGTRAFEFEVELDFISHRLEMRCTDGAVDSFALESGTLSRFYARYFAGLRRLGIEVDIYPLAVEIPDTIYLDRDETFRPYDPAWAQRFFGALVQVDRLLKAFRGGFLGKASPVHFFWGSFDLAVTRFSGRPAPPPPSNPNIPDFINREAYSHEVSSCGFWPGNGGFGRPAFYSYAYPHGCALREDARIVSSPLRNPEGRAVSRSRGFDLPRNDVQCGGRPGTMGPAIRRTCQINERKAEGHP